MTVCSAPVVEVQEPAGAGTSERGCHLPTNAVWDWRKTTHADKLLSNSESSTTALSM